MAIFHYGDKTYYHMMQDPTQVQASETKKARKHAATKARRARRAAISEARKLLKTPEVGSTTKVPIIITMLQNHLAKLAIGIKPLAIVLNIIKGP